MRKEQKELNYNMKLQQLLCLVLSNLFRNSEEMPELVLAGNKLPAQASKGGNMVQQDKNINASETLRQNIQKQNSELHCSRPMSRDNGGRINPTL